MILDLMDIEVEPVLLINKDYNYFDENPKAILKGIYACICAITGKPYEGSSNNIKRRIREHLKALRENSSDSTSFQNAFNFYGEETMEWYWIEPVRNDDALKLTEQTWFDVTQPFQKRGYNCCKSALRPPALKDNEDRNPREIKDPEGNIHSFLCSLTEFAANHNLNRNSLGLVLSGRQESHKGWSLPETEIPEKKPKKLKDPNGVIHEFYCSIAEFSRNNNLLRSEVQNLFYGISRQHKGWTLPEMEIEPKTVYTLENIDGRVESFTNISEFSRKHELCNSNVNVIISGERISIKGWHRVGEQPPSWEFLDHNGKYYKTYNLLDFCKEYDIQRNGIARVILGDRKHYLGWRLPDTEKQDEKSYQSGLNKRNRYRNSQKEKKPVN